MKIENILQKTHTGAYTLHLPVFEGPFELLLFFIQKEDIDIHAVPLAKITDNFLSYIHTMQEHHLPIASEFLRVAAILMRLKIRRLLPLSPAPEEEKEEMNEEELQAHLQTYAMYKRVAEMLHEKARARAKQHARAYFMPPETENKTENKTENEKLSTQNLQKPTLHLLAKAYIQGKDKKKKRQAVLRPAPPAYQVPQQKKYMLQEIQKAKTLHIQRIIEENRPDGRLWFIYNFLALLELCHENVLCAPSPAEMNDFFFTLKK